MCSLRRGGKTSRGMQAQMGAGCCTSSQAKPAGRGAPSCQFPRQGFARAQWLEPGGAKSKAVRGRPGFAAQRDAAGVARQAVEVGAVETGKAFEPPERAGLVESLGIQLDGGMGG